MGYGSYDKAPCSSDATMEYVPRGMSASPPSEEGEHGLQSYENPYKSGPRVTFESDYFQEKADPNTIRAKRECELSREDCNLEPCRDNSGAQVVLGYAIHDKDGRLEPFTFTRRAPLADDVVFRILYCGICHTDLHQMRDEWMDLPATYPMVPGHEMVGAVCEVGSAVKKYKIGDRVGVGCMVDSCRHCSYCNQGLEQYCEQKFIWTYNDKNIYTNGEVTYGGYSTLMVAPERFVVKIPESLPLDAAAPLLCAGITVYSPMKQYKMECGPQSKSFGVIGLGGLGYMAAKFARAMGMTLTVISTSLHKEVEARDILRADEFIVSTNLKQMQKAAKSLDFILDTISAEHSFDQYLPLLRTNGKLVLVGIPAKPLQVSSMLLACGRRCVGGSLIGGVAETQEMLNFCGKHHIFCLVEKIPMSYVNTALERLAKSNVKYRFVIDCSTMRHPTEIFGFH